MGFRFLVLFLLDQVKGALQRELDDFSTCVFGRGWLAIATAAAVCIARRALKHTVFEALNQRLVEGLEDRPGAHRWLGLRVMVVDGSILNLPATNALYEHFGGQCQGGRQYPMARLSQLFDVDSGLSWHAVVAPLTRDERTLAFEHLAHVPANSVVLYDRGYPGFCVFAGHLQAQRDFCMRLPRSFHDGVEALMQSADASRRFILTARKSVRRLCRAQALSVAPIELRMIRIVLSTGAVEILGTTLLDETRYPDGEFAKLYAQRWAIEGDFRIQKARMQIENFTGKRTHVILQDVHARILTKNIASWIAAQAQAALDAAKPLTAPTLATEPTPQRDTNGSSCTPAMAPPRKKPARRSRVRKRRQRINFTDVLHACKHALIQLLLGLHGVLERILERLPRYRHCERKGRTSARRLRKGKGTLRFPMAYKQTA